MILHPKQFPVRWHMLLVAIIALAALSMAGCGPAGDQPPAGEGEQEPVSITDDRESETEFATTPDRIVSIGPVNTEILYAIGAGDLVVGVDMFSDWPDATGEVDGVGDLREPNIEVIAALEPDVVIISHTTMETIEKLEGMDLKVVALLTEDLDGLNRNAERLGRITGHEDGAERLLAAMEEAFDCIREAIGEVDEKPRVFFEIDPDPLWTAGGGSFPDLLIDMAGGKNIFSDMDPWAEVSSEAVIDRDPDIILGTLEQTREMIDSGQRSGWDNISAVRENRVEILDDDLINRAGPRLILGFAEMAEAMWPQRLDELPCVEEYESNLMQWIEE